MALPKEDEMLLAGLYDQTMARRGGRSGSPSLNRMQSFDPAINPPPAPRNVTPAALTPKQTWDPALNPPAASTVARGQRGAGLPPIAASPSAAYTGGQIVRAPFEAASNVASGQYENAARGIGSVVRGVKDFTAGLFGSEPPVNVIPDAQAKTTTRTPAAATNPLNPLNGNTATAIPSGKAAAAPASAAPASELTASGRMYRTLTGQRANTALNSDNAGSATIQGRFMNKDGTRGPQETRAYTQGGIEDAGKRVNVVKGLFSGISPESEAALSTARKAAADRGDFAAVERSYADTPEKKAAYNQQAAETKILSAVGKAPLSQLPQVAQAVSGIQAGRTAAALGGQKLEEGAAAAQTLQAKRALYEQLGALDPADTKGRSALIDQILAYEGKAQTPVKSLGYEALTDPTGMTPGMTFSKDTGQIGQQGGAQAAQPDGVYEMEGIGKVTVRGGIAYDEKGNILQ